MKRPKTYFDELNERDVTLTLTVQLRPGEYLVDAIAREGIIIHDRSKKIDPKKPKG